MKNCVPTNNLGEWDKFLERHKLPKEPRRKRTSEQTNNKTIKEIKNIPQS